MLMRKFLSILIFSTFLLFACSSESDSDSNEEQIRYINPPEWIIGAWNALEDSTEVEQWIFSSDDVVMIKNDVIISQRRQVEGYQNAGHHVETEEVIEEDLYSITFYFPYDEVTYSFEKEQENTIIWIEKTATYSKN